MVSNVSSRGVDKKEKTELIAIVKKTGGKIDALSRKTKGTHPGK